MRLLCISPVSRCVARAFGPRSRLSLCSLRPVAVTGLVSGFDPAQHPPSAGQAQGFARTGPGTLQ